MRYIWQFPDWPKFIWDLSALTPLLAAVRQAQGFLRGQLAILGLREKEVSRGRVLVEEALQTSAIEGEKLNIEALRSSVARRLGINLGAKNVRDRKADGVVEMLFDATADYFKPLTADRLFRWHSSLFPEGYFGARKVETGKWRSKPVYVVSGPVGREKVRYEAVPPESVAREMSGFFQWWKDDRKKMDGLIRAGLAHLYFVQIHPFEDGNGRIARTLADMALAQDEDAGQRYYSLSEAILKDRPNYYKVLEKTGKNGMDVTPWLVWFLRTLRTAIENSTRNLDAIWTKMKYWNRNEHLELNTRQRKILNRLLDAEPGGFEGGLTTRKYVAIAKTSRATAFREIDDLLKKKLIKPRAGKGRSASYEVVKG